MSTLIIKDLHKSDDLDRNAMATIQGGMCGACPPSFGLPSSYPGAPGGAPGWGPQLLGSKNDMNFNATQLLNQSQNTTVNNGNNAAFVSGITANVTPIQSGSNNIRFG